MYIYIYVCMCVTVYVSIYVSIYVCTRWAVLGLDFLLLSCTPRVLATMSQPRFESLKKQMEKTLDHLVGETTPSLIKGGIGESCS